MTAQAGPLKVLHLHGSFEPGGKEARVIQLMRAWGPHMAHSVLIGSGQLDGGKAAIPVDLDVVFPDDAPSLTGRPSFTRLRRLGEYMRGFDLVLSYNWGAMDGVMAHRLFASALDLPPLVHHEDGFNADEADGLKWQRNLYRRFALATVSALVVPSSVLAHIAIRDWHQPARRVRHIPNGIDVAAYDRKPDPTIIPGLLPRNAAGGGNVVVGTLAGLRPVKNLPRLVRAVAAMDSPATLAIVGEGAERARISAEAEQCGLTRLVMPGHLAEPARYIGLFDIFALSSDSEQFPISVAEAMAAGLPVVSTDVGDVSAMVSAANRPYIVHVDDETGFAVALSALAGDAHARSEVGEANRERARQCFSERAMIHAYAEVYRDALGQKKMLPDPVS